MGSLQGPERPEPMQIHIPGPKNPLKASVNKSKQERRHQVCPSKLVFATHGRARARALRVQKLLLGQLSVTAHRITRQQRGGRAAAP